MNPEIRNILDDLAGNIECDLEDMDTGHMGPVTWEEILEDRIVDAWDRLKAIDPA